MARTNETTKLLDVLSVMEPEGLPLRGMQFCITGHLSKPRDEWVQLIQAAGGTFSKTIHYGVVLVTNEDWTPGSTATKVSNKFAMASRARCQIWSEQKLIDTIIQANKE